MIYSKILSRAFLGILCSEMSQKSILVQKNKNTSENFPNDTETPKNWNEPKAGAWNDGGTPMTMPPCFGVFSEDEVF